MSMTDATSRGGGGLPAAVRTVLVLGAGLSGMAAAAGLRALGLEVSVSDAKPAEVIPGLDALLEAGVVFVPQEAPAGQLSEVDLVVKSPGIPAEAPAVMEARRLGIPVWSEIELAYALLGNPFSVITGTNGKTTTTALLGHLFATAGRSVRVLGNIGTAVTSVLGAVGSEEELVVEVSSFQAEDIHAFRPAVGVFLNLTPDHLDRHGTMDRYLRCKANLFANQGPQDTAVLNLDDPAAAGLGRDLLAKRGGPRVLFFSTAVSAQESAAARGAHSWIAEERLVLVGTPSVKVEELQIPGRHNLENCLAAGTAALARGVDMAAVCEGLRTFRGVVHRLEKAGIIAGVTYVNDSKATNVDATLTALSAYPEGTHLILGGRDKASDYRPIARACARGCAAVYLIGEATPLIEEAFREVRTREKVEGVPVPVCCGDLETAVQAAALVAHPGDVVLLAPACASFDQYNSFEERGEHFREIVAALMREAQ